MKTVAMAYQGTASIVAEVSVRCEACGHEYSFRRTLRAYARHENEMAATAAAQDSLARQVAQIESGDYGPVASQKPCPQCGYLQSWMVGPVRRRRSWQWALATASGVYLVALLGLIFVRPEGLKSDDCLVLLTLVGASAIIFLAARAILLWTYQPNRHRDVPPQTNAPTIRFRRS